MNDSKNIESAEVGWSDTVVMVCNKCGKQFDGPSLKDSPERIKSELKAKAKSELGKKVRVITTSCLNICPINKIAIVVASSDGSSVFKAYSVDPKISGDEIYKTIFKKK